MSEVRVAALYKFASQPDPAGVRDALHARLAETGIRGTLLIAHEGINGTIAGAPEAIEGAVAALRALPGCADLDVKWSRAAAMPFHRLKVKVKREIVTLGEPAADPSRNVGTYVAPRDWNALIDDPATIVIDTRNDYEVRIGSFAGAIDPATPSFRDFPAWFRANRAGLDGKRVAMFCTGGIRCEKATALLRAEGIDDVHHLKGGILAYLEQMPAADSRWQGECFVFDERVAVRHDLTPGTHTLCRGCRMPVGPDDRASLHYVEGVSCPGCHGTRDAATQAGYAERHRQVELATARGEVHVGAAMAHPTAPAGAE